MFNRLAYGAVAILAIFTVFLFDALISDTTKTGILCDLARKGSLIPILFAILSFGGAVELARLMKSAGLKPLVPWAVCGSVVLMLSPWLVGGILTPRYPMDFSGPQWQLSMMMLLLGGAVLAVLPRRDLGGALNDVAATWAIMIYAGFLPSFALQLRCHDFLHGPDGVWLLLIVLTVIKVSDIGAFFIGSAIGRHKLIPWISPKKSVEGALGGIFSSIAVSLLFWFAFDWFSPELNLSVPGGREGGEVVPLMHTMTQLFHSLTISQVIIFGAVMSISGQLGDLLESVFKRSAGAKDSAKLLPAFGGVLDIIDSPVLACPVAWFLLTCLWPVV
ncbi:MAG: phosphatidate cytidylyltransferase [Phycisphaerae bacterium]|nr:phosphatidate cytidylyltransferase [Phycisphaerae bacterium]